MSKIIIRQDLVTNPDDLIKICPFGAIEYDNNYLSINAACKMCNICVKTGPQGVFSCFEEKVEEIDKSLWRGISVYVDHHHGHIHPVTYELIGKAKELAAKIKHPVYCLFIGRDISQTAHSLLAYGVDDVFVYDNPELEDFRIEPYTAVFEDFINRQKPSIILVGSTNLGRSLAPRVAARFGTGLTADCTILDVDEDTNLAQIRPAFGGNIMAHIYTPNHRPQFATVRYKVFSAPQKISQPTGKVTFCDIANQALQSRIRVLSTKDKEKVRSVEDAEIIVVAGRAVKNQKDLDIINKLAEQLGGMVAVTRPLIEAGLADARLQIGLSGRTVKPKLLIACGVSGAIQFVAGMDKADVIFAINNDDNAPIFNIAHYGIVGDVFEIVPRLMELLDQSRQM
ncbi:electron transfer flavoprotein subunit alpha/FixB family protein [Sporomusa sphaeroides]|uniref:Acryloyl-CoA reductase electron transfer subunit beta n=1 Tax=Sporomusa sphaeroides DSM 2875 TaxID=1337886 RepID=A0ABP2C5W9_9FIRM|nr:electron transfer flavoprotein subunit alpha/FixB family protein [Sporomusa sphaeroides]OLS58706.1 acryloyl-CoA reductase electron transfer subunit beta [Sporomusa sphaeroides DSM 2875]CVK19784.1 Acryloyl-CoA reductase electron transfer subunit beta [Sporomusa sphaeroides DSM 2875]